MVGVWNGEWWLLALGAVGIGVLLPRKWRQEGRAVPSEVLLVVVLLGLVLVRLLGKRFDDMEFAELFVVLGAVGAVGGLLDHLLLVRSLSRPSKPPDG